MLLSKMEPNQLQNYMTKFSNKETNADFEFIDQDIVSSNMGSK